MAMNLSLDLYPTEGKRVTYGDLKEFTRALYEANIADDSPIAVLVNMEFRRDGLATIKRLSVIKES